VTLLRDLQATARLLRRAAIQRHRLDAQKARTDMRDWAKARRDRTRHLIELGGLVQKAGLVELVDDDRATLLGAFLDLADRLRGADDAGDDPRHLATRWRRRGLRAFDADRDAAAVTEQSEAGRHSYKL
jgi:Conjugal transfer protein TraD